MIGSVGFVASQPRLPHGPSAEAAPGEWVGVVHVHTVASDGGGTVDDVARVANRERLDFVVVTDHNRFADPDWSYREGTLIVVGEEALTSEGSHLVVIGGEDPALREGERLTVPEEPDGALRIVAHPMGPSRPWRGGFPPSIDALEIWNADTERRGDPLSDWVPGLLLLARNPVEGLYRLQDRPARSLELWDSLQHREGPDEGSVAGICSVDAHHRMPVGSFDVPFPAYRHSFSMARMHVLLDAPPTGDARTDGWRVVEALREGRSYCSFPGLADGRGVRVAITDGKERAGPGGRIHLGESTTLRVDLPPAGDGARVDLFRDGERIATGRGPVWQVAIEEPGWYRVEASLDLPRDGRGWLPWLLVNPIRVVRPPDEAAAGS